MVKKKALINNSQRALSDDEEVDIMLNFQSIEPVIALGSRWFIGV